MSEDKHEYRVATVEEIAQWGGVLARAAGLEFGVFAVEGAVVAYENRCPHQGGPVCAGVVLGKTEQIVDERGEIIDEILDDRQMRLICPWHGWEYDLASGVLAHDRRRRLRPVDLVVRDGIVYVRVPAATDDIEG